MNQVIKQIDELCMKYDDCELVSYGTVEEGFDTNEAEVFCIPRFINDYDTNYFSDESQIHDFIDDFDSLDLEGVTYRLEEPTSPEDDWVLFILW